MFKFNASAESTELRGLTAEEIEVVVGGVMPGPNGEGCTEPRWTKGGTIPFFPFGPRGSITLY